jgi:hypothetical protein
MGHPREHKVPLLRFAPVGMTELLREGMAQAEREAFIEEEEMDAGIERMLNSPLLAHRTREKWGTRHGVNQ